VVRGRGATNGGTILEEADTRRHRIVIGRTLEEGKELYEEVGREGIWRRNRFEEKSSLFWLKGSKIMLSKSAQIEGKGCDCGK